MRAPLRRSFVLALQVALLLFLIEGMASYFRTVVGFARESEPPFAERQHTQYDPELGWVARPNVRIDDLYGHGVFLRTNARGFRGARETPARVPDGMRRIVCSGDSFTLGYGVDDNRTWCARLGGLLRNVESVNLGQGGYGIDQSYLWFRREAPQLEHQLHLFAFIHEDFLRMEVDHFSGYGKPVLAIDANGALEVRNVPVPRGEFTLPWLTQNVHLLRNLDTFVLLERLIGAWIAPRPPRVPGADAGALALRVFDSLAGMARENGSLLVLVYLPMREDLEPNPGDPARAWLATEVARRGILLLDLIPDFRRLDAEITRRFFIRPGEVQFPSAAGHYTVEGNAEVANALREGLLALPAVRGRLGLNAP